MKYTCSYSSIEDRTSHPFRVCSVQGAYKPILVMQSSLSKCMSLFLSLRDSNLLTGRSKVWRFLVTGLLFTDTPWH